MSVSGLPSSVPGPTFGPQVTVPVAPRSVIKRAVAYSPAVSEWRGGSAVPRGLGGRSRDDRLA